MTTPFAELLGRSCFSFLEGASHPEELVVAATELGLSGFALCDRDGLYGSVRAHAQGKKLGRHVAVGAELTLEDSALPSVALLARDHEGYSNLCRLLTAAHADHEKGQAGISLAEVAAHARGLVAVAPLDDPGAVPGAEAAASLAGDAVRRDLDSSLGVLRDAFGEHAVVATFRRLDGRDGARTALAERAEARHGLTVVASGRPLFHHPSRRALADVVHCIRRKTTLDRAGAGLSANGEAFLRSPDAMARLFRDRVHWVVASADVAGRCLFGLDDVHYSFPSDTLCLPGETADAALRRLVTRGSAVRYPGGTPPAVQAQIDKELALIARLDVAPYFLSVREIVEIARSRRILCQGRGSAANSAVCFVLGITAVDPARSNLLFERFLSAERAEPPDIDVDFEHERREEVIQEIYARYGRARAAMVSEVICYRGKSALREVGKVFGLSLDQVDRLASLGSQYHAADATAERLVELGLDPADGRLQKVVRLAGLLEGFPRHLSIHVGGFVLSAEDLSAVAPIEPARMEGRTVIPWDKDDIDDLGFFKVDVLGLGMLTAIRKTLGLLHQHGLGLQGVVEPFDPIEALAAIPPEDPVVYDAICAADTIGVFQIESRAQMAMLPRLRPRTFYDLVIEVAIVRPGPIQGGMVHPYLRRRTGKEEAVSPHPCLDTILERTLGVPLFQEQVMQIAMVGAGYTPGEADQLRRDMAAWKKHGRLERHRPRLLAGFAERGIDTRFGEQLYQQVQGFGEYGFPESHAASFALLVYASAWLKVHHGAAFACSLLNAQPMGFYSPSSIVQDLQRHGVEVRPACVARSDWDNLLEPVGSACPPPLAASAPAGAAASLADLCAAAPDAPRFAMRLGLRQIKGMGEEAGRAVERARACEPFASLDDFVRRTALRKNEVEALAEAGALSALVPARREALWRARGPRAPGLFEGRALERDVPVGLPPLRSVEQLLLDYGRTGLSIDDHPMRHLRERLDRLRPRVVRSADLGRMKHGTPVVVAGLVIGRQRPMTASGVTFVTLEDETGIVNLVVWRDVFEQQHAVARHAKMVLVRGRLEREGEVIHVIVNELRRLDLRGGAELAARSRDFH